MCKLEMVISVDILMAKVNWEGRVFLEEMVFLCVCMCVYSEIFFTAVK